jgi:mono/diheme cytochrome c family protein
MKYWQLAFGLAVVAAIASRPLAAQEDEGQTVYRKQCKTCHGLKGTPPARALAKYKKIKVIGEENFVSSLSEDSIVTILQKGTSKDMKSFKAKLTEAQMRAVATYIKQLGGEAKKEGT